MKSPYRDLYAALGVLFCQLSTCTVFSAPETPLHEYVCLRTNRPPVLDGRLDDTCWNEAADVGKMTRLGPDGGLSKDSRASVRFVCDETNVYAAFDVAAEPGVTPIGKEQPKRIFQDHSVELFIHPSPASCDYAQLVLNCSNAGIAFFRWNEKAESQVDDQEPRWKHATQAQPGKWTAEVAIPRDLFAAPLLPGHVWKVRMGHNAPDQPHEMWPQNSSLSFHNIHCGAYLICEDRNVLPNGGFETGGAEAGHALNWRYLYHDEEGKGIISLEQGAAPEGTHQIRYEKFSSKQWFPQLWSDPVPVQPFSAYKVSFMVNSPKTFVMRWGFFDKTGRRTHRFSDPQSPTDGYERRSITFRMEDQAPNVAVGIQYSRTAGVMWIDDARMERLNGLEFRNPPPADPHRYHRLEALAARRPFKPRELVLSQEHQQSERVIFRDSGSGAWIWRLTDTPGDANRHYYMEACPWNCDGTRFMLTTREWGPRVRPLFNATGTDMELLHVPGGWFAWDRERPGVFYFCNDSGSGSGAFSYDIGTGELRHLRDYKGRCNAWVISQDNRYLLIKEYFPDAPLDEKTKIHLLALDGSEDITLDPKGHIHQLWFTKLPDHSVEFEYEHGGYTPEQYLDGNYMLRKDGTLKRIYGGDGIWAGHRAHSPSGRFMCPGGRLQIVDKLTGEITKLGPGGTNHQTWDCEESWLAGSSGIHLIRAATDGRDFVQRIGSHNSRIGHSTYWAEAHPTMSPDGTKLAFASSMLGDIDFHFIVMRLPQAPRNLDMQKRGDTSELSWSPPLIAKEIGAYAVYGASASGGPYKRIADNIRERKFDLPNNRPHRYFRVTAIEQSGLESLPSDEFCVDPEWNGHVTVVSEAERAPITAPPAMEIFDTTATGFYALNLGMDRPAVNVPVDFCAPRDGDYAVWVRSKNAYNPFVLEAQIDGSSPRTRQTGSEGPWTWIRLLDDARLATGKHRLLLTANTANVLIDQVLVTTDSNAVPKKSGFLLDTDAPAVPQNTDVRASSPYSLSISWTPPEDTDLHHINIYLAHGNVCNPEQPNLIASPGGSGPYVAWGLEQNTGYTIVLTAVDRAGNESPPTKPVQTRTPEQQKRFLLNLDLNWKTAVQDQISVPVEIPVASNVVVWTRWQNLEKKRKGTAGSFELALGKTPFGKQPIRFGYVCVGHGGPVVGDQLWNFSAPYPAEADGGTRGLPFPVGEHELIFRRVNPADDLLLDGLVITNDFGFLPKDGWTSFLPKR